MLIPLVIVAAMCCCCVCQADHESLPSHVELLHLLFVEDTVAIVRGSTSVVHSVHVGNYEVKILGNGDILEKYHEPSDVGGGGGRGGVGGSGAGGC